VKAERRGRATIYDFDKTALLDYLQGDTAIDGLGRETCQLDEHLLPLPQAGQPASWTGTYLPVGQAPTCQLDRHLPASPLRTIIKIEKERERKNNTHKRNVVCAVPFFSSQEDPNPSKEVNQHEVTLNEPVSNSKTTDDDVKEVLLFVNNHNNDIREEGSPNGEKMFVCPNNINELIKNSNKSATSLITLLQHVTFVAIAYDYKATGFNPIFYSIKSYNLSYFFKYLNEVELEYNNNI